MHGPGSRSYLKRMWRFLRILLLGLVGVAALGAALLFYFLYTPAPQEPHLTGRLSRGRIAAGGLERSYLLYVPRGLPKDAPLVVVMHGSGENGARIRIETGYGFERLADAHGFAVAYPNGYDGYWNACNIVGDYEANKRNIDDVGFLVALTDRLVHQTGIDPSKVFATGISRGGHMAYRLALDAPQRFRAVAAVAANLPAPGNFKCEPAGRDTPPMMIVDGTDDPLNPFEGGEVTLFGFLKRGTVLSARASAEYFARANGIAGPPERQVQGDVERLRWRGQVELLAIHGGGHVLPQPYWRAPRLLGTTSADLDGPAAIWAFFEKAMKGRR